MAKIGSLRMAGAALCLLLACAAGFAGPQRQDELARFARSAAKEIAGRIPAGSPVGMDQFRAEDGDRLAADLTDSATEAFRRELVVQPGPRLVETEKLDAILSTLEAQASGAYDPGSVAAIGRLIGAKYLGLGRVGTRGGRYVIAFRLVAVETGEIVFSDDLELAPAGARDLVRVYAPARYRVSLGALWLPLKPTEFSVVEGLLGFSYEIAARHSLSANVGMLGLIAGSQKITWASTDPSVLPFCEAAIKADRGFDAALGYGFLLPVTPLLTAKPYAQAGYTRLPYEALHYYFDGATFSESDEDIYHGFFAEVGLEVMVPYSNPIGMWLSAGYRQYITPIEDSFARGTFDGSYSEVQVGFTLAGGVKVHF